MAFSNHDIVFDSPTNNFATLNPLFISDATNQNNPTNGNLYLATSSTGREALRSTFLIRKNTGKWYWEFVTDNAAGGSGISIDQYTDINDYYYGDYNWVYYDGVIVHNASTVTTLSPAPSVNTVIGVMVDTDADVITFYSGGQSIGSANITSNQDWYVIAGDGSGAIAINVKLNFGQDPTFGGNKVPTKVYTDANGIGRFFHEPPTGALALCTANLAAATTAPTEYIVDETNQHLLTYNGNVTQSKFTPYATDGHSLYSSNAGLKLTDTASNFNYLHNNTTDYTVSFWMYRMQDAGSSEILIDSTGGTTGAHGIYFLIDGGGTDKLRIYINKNVSGSSAFKFESNYVVPLRQWVHVSFVFDLANPSGQASTKGKLYINGNLYTSGTYQQDGGYSSSDASRILTLGSAYDGSTYFYGYIADFRIVKNKTVYSGNYTPPNSPYSVSETDQDILISASSVSIKDSNTTVTAKTVTPVGSGEVSISDWSPYTPEAVRTGYEYRNPDEHGGGSFYLSGSGQQILFPTNTDFDFGSGEFSVEMWVYLKSAITGNTPLFGYGNDAGSDYTSFHFEATGGKLQFYQSGSITFTETTASVLVGQWNHLVLSRSGNTINVYSNGQKVITNNFTDATRSGHNLRIGSWYNTTNYGSNGNLNGYITDYKIVKGTTVYSEDGNGNITPPTGPITSDANTKLLLQPYKSKIAKDILNYASDETGKALTYDGNANVVNTSPYKDGVTGSFSVTGNENLKLADSDDWDLGSSFTAECWFYGRGSTSTNTQYLMSKWHTAKQYRWYFTSTSAPYGQLAFEYDNGDNTFTDGGTFTTGMSANRWYHIAFVNNGSTTKLYINGVAASGSGTIGNVNLTSDFLRVLGTGDPNASSNAFITDFRIVKGQALYTADFTPSAYSLSSTHYTTNGQDPSDSNSTRTAITGTVSLLAQPGRFIENTAEADNTDNFKAVTYTGKANSSTYNNGVVTVGFQPDLVWIKARNQGYNHTLFDSVRGFGKKHLFSDLTSQELANEYGHVSGTNASSFSVADGASGDTYTNNSSTNYVAWCWKAGGTPSTDGKAMVDGEESTIAGDAKLDAGTITPTRMSVNTKAGFSIVKYIGDGNNGDTFSHGLNQTPDISIIKNLDSSTDNWYVGGYPNLSAFSANNKLMNLNTDVGMQTASSNALTNGSSLITIDTAGSNLGSTGVNYIAYCWHSVEGFSKFGSYTGNGSPDGPFVYCGFRPAFVMVKNTASGYNWTILDSARDSYNVANHLLYPSTATTENSSAARADFLSNGFKSRDGLGNDNISGQTYIYMAFAEQPFIYSNAR